MSRLFLTCAAVVAVLSLVTFVAYGADKQKARCGARRIPEKTLLLLSFLGGALGGFLAMRIFHHKTRGEHWYFTAVNLLSLALHAALLIFCYLHT